MFRYILALLVISPYSGCLGVPLPTRPADGPLANLLAALANHCPNSYLTEQIKSKLNDCNVVVPPYNEKQFVCMMFYDINKQLCNAVNESKLTLPNNYTNNLNDELDVQNTCELAKSWTASDIIEYPDYKKNILRVFNVTIGCLKVCGVEDVTSQDTNFYCKYYKWGTDMLRPQPSAISANENTADSLNPDMANVNRENQLQDVKVDIKSNLYKPEIANNYITQVQQPNEISNSSVSSNLEGNKVEKTAPSVLQVPVDNIKELQQKPSGTEDVPEKPPLDVASTNGNTEGNINDTPTAVEEEPPKKQREGEMIPDIVTHTQMDQKVINEENDNTKNNVAEPDADYRDVDSEESKDTVDGADETVDDPSIDGEVIEKPRGKQTDYKVFHDTPKLIGKVLKKVRQHKSSKLNSRFRDRKVSEEKGEIDTSGRDRLELKRKHKNMHRSQNKKKNETLPPKSEIRVNERKFKLKNIIKPKEVTLLETMASIMPIQDRLREKKNKQFYSNTVPEQFVEDDDHFFPFFFSGVILAVLLYILYHNKSKVSKVFLGLIVEGRQPGRRRNSRGHAYKRLDTLEQAMSTNSAAPPSKIIY